ncbi:conserved hypothetical protein [Serratia proteamaculans]|uniref:hypothetical protein n=1 Tax=Serratia proteamaculans TaxID=28151 RepID=UPI0009F7B782|nr:hypothetical protein [Serratia proteamaculans]SMB40910.1 conserved hypothetical protein [Serratia proteamaculans]
MCNYNYYRMLEEIMEEYSNKLDVDYSEQVLLSERIEEMRKNLRVSVFQKLIADRCYIAGLDKRPLVALTESPEMEEYLYSVQTEILTRIAKTERAIEISNSETLL